MTNELIELEKFIGETPIPIILKKPLTFLAISKQPHYENVWSNIYAFYFNTTGEHNLGDLFLQSLIQLINEKTNEKFTFNASFDIETEYGTKNKGRIDLLLSNINEAIIIENKVHHYLKNDLQDYWNSVSQRKKIGIILSCRKINKSQIGHPDFIGILHLELLKRVMANLSNNFSNPEGKYIVFLRDFYQNVINITDSMDIDVIQFSCRNQEKINQIKKIRDSYVAYVISEVEEAIKSIDEKFDLYSSRNENFRYYMCPNQRDLMITIVFEKLFTESKELSIIVELQNEFLKNKERIKNINFEKEEEEYLLNEFYNNNNKMAWAHLACQSIILTENDIINLGEFIAETINKSPILNIYRKIKNTLVDDIT